MTNFEAIKNYSLEEMAKFIAEHDKNCDIADGKYCSEICDQRVKGRHHTEEHKKKISDSLKRFHGERREP